MKVFQIIFFFLTISLIFFQESYAGWEIVTSKDEMTGKKSCYAISPIVSPTKPMDFPYSNTKAWLGVGYNGNNYWVFIGFNIEPNIVNFYIKDSYNLIKTRVKWGEGKIENVSFIQEWGSKFLQFENSYDIIQKLKKYNSMLLELNWFGEGRVYFKFPLKGSSNAIENLKKKCQ